MRKIAFRAWSDDDGGGFIGDWDTGEFSEVTIGDGYFEVHQNTLVDRLVNGEHDQSEEYVCYNSNSDDGLKLMQFTGLKDKNGVNIYSGDLIASDSGRICKVVWHDASACFDAEFVSDRSHTHDNSYGFKCNLWGLCVEVIGNIHENPELLEAS